ncbi:hypothetical protein ACIBLA_06725 [Streptomyces sp. NPDC050433]|uniref:hypothetical protein n=1 Tax=Streptomyces sp. NPDC050433 TaxID=3365615 RepID=UPI00379F2EA9
MTASDGEHAERRRADSVAALCLLLDDPDGQLSTDGQVAEAVGRARRLLIANAAPDQLDAAFGAVDEALRRAGDARGLLGNLRGEVFGYPAIPATLPGVRPMIKVALCPGTVPCTRREPAKDLRRAPACAVNGVEMRKERLRGDLTG